MKHRFCNVFWIKKRLFVARQEYAGGPGRMVFPPKELEATLSAEFLGLEIEAALADYRDLGRKIFAEEWALLNNQLLTFFEEASTAAFERKKRDVTLRQDAGTGEVAIFGPKNRELTLLNPPPFELGQAVRDMLDLGHGIGKGLG